MAEYYSPSAKTRWCLSLYDNVGHHSLGVFPQAAMVLFSYSIENFYLFTIGFIVWLRYGTSCTLLLCL